MDLERNIDLPALFWRSTIGGDRFAAAVVLRRTYAVSGTGLQLAAEQPWGVSMGPWDTPQGPHAGDGFFRRGGVDLLAFGTARAPEGRPVPEFDLRFACKDWSRRVRVLGPRSWTRNWGKKLLPSPPQPVASVPLGLAQAYGGTDELDGVVVPYPDNPAGCGWAATADTALGRALPAFEDPERPLQAWDQPVPVLGFGFCPLANGDRLRRGTEHDARGALKTITPRLFNDAYDGAILPTAAPGDQVRVHGLLPTGELAFRLPSPPCAIALQFGEQEHVKEPAIDQIGIEADLDRVFITWRYAFRYAMKSLQKRRCRLVASGERV